MSSLDARSQMTPETAQLVLATFARTYRMHGSRLVDRHGNVAPDYTLGLVVQAQAVLA
jgi:hypothetical protein